MNDGQSQEVVELLLRLVAAAESIAKDLRRVTVQVDDDRGYPAGHAILTTQHRTEDT